MPPVLGLLNALARVVRDPPEFRQLVDNCNKVLLAHRRHADVERDAVPRGR